MLSAINCGVNTAIAAAATNIAAAPAKHPVMAAIATANIANEPASATRPLAISSHVIPPKSSRASANINNAADIAATPAAVANSFAPGINLTAAAIIVKEPAIAVSPLPISCHDISPNLSNALAITFIASAITNIPADATSNEPALFVIFENIAISANTAATPSKP